MLRTATIVGRGHRPRSLVNLLASFFHLPNFWKRSFTTPGCSPCFLFLSCPLILRYSPRQLSRNETPFTRSWWTFSMTISWHKWTYTGDSNILDLVLTTSPDLVNHSFIGEPFSDHNSISFLLSGTPYVQRKSGKLLYCYGKADWDHLRSLIFYIPWHCAFFDSDINHSWACLKNLLFTAVDECIPKRKNRRSNAPWITKELIVCKKKKSLYNRARRSNTTATWEKRPTLAHKSPYFWAT